MSDLIVYIGIVAVLLLPFVIFFLDIDASHEAIIRHRHGDDAAREWRERRRKLRRERRDQEAQQ